jgi:hypothetical protein
MQAHRECVLLVKIMATVTFNDLVRTLLHFAGKP